MELNQSAVTSALLAYDAVIEVDATTGGKLLAMRAALEAYLKESGVAPNAERYLFLRDQWDGTMHWYQMEVLRDGGEDMDAAVDALMAQKGASNG